VLVRLPTPDDTELTAAIRRYVTPGTGSIKRYLKLLHGALLHIDAALGTDHAARFLTDGGRWQQWRSTEEAPAELRTWIDRLCSVADECMRKA
jgi:hypothetical protein